MIRWALVAAAISGFLAVVLGALGAHDLRGMLDPHAHAVFDTASRYHFVHTLALGAGALAPAAGASRAWSAVACWAWLAGIVVFCGSLYALALTGVTWLGAMTPFGGVAFLVGWAALAVAALRARG